MSYRISTLKHARRLQLELEENAIGIRSVNRDMTHGASLVLLRLIVKRGNSRRRGIYRQRVALKAEQVYLTAFQQPRIRRPMRRMTNYASFRFHRSVLEHKWTGLVGVTGEANLILSRRGAELPGQESAVRIVAISASNQPFVHSMMKGFGELWLDLVVASVAKHGLRDGEESAFHSGMVRRMTIDAAHIVLEVFRAKKVGVLFAEFVAA